MSAIIVIHRSYEPPCKLVAIFQIVLLNKTSTFMQVYEDLVYKLSLEFPSTYPYSPPTVRFVTPCFHPNVDMAGNICLDILKEKWSALYDVRSILLSIQSLLGGEWLCHVVTFDFGGEADLKTIAGTKIIASCRRCLSYRVVLFII